MTRASISRDLLEVLACPVCKGNIKITENRLVCKKCGREYSIEETIPQMLPEELS